MLAPRVTGPENAFCCRRRAPSVCFLVALLGSTTCRWGRSKKTTRPRVCVILVAPRWAPQPFGGATTIRNCSRPATTLTHSMRAWAATLPGPVVWFFGSDPAAPGEPRTKTVWFTTSGLKRPGGATAKTTPGGVVFLCSCPAAPEAHSLTAAGAPPLLGWMMFLVFRPCRIHIYIYIQYKHLSLCISRLELPLDEMYRRKVGDQILISGFGL